MKRFGTLMITMLLALTTYSVAGTSVALLLTGSGKTVAQLSPDFSGNVVFNNLPDGKYKLEVSINAKRFPIECDVDNDGIGDLEVSTQRDNPAGGGSTFAKSKAFRIVVNDKGKRKAVSMSEWMQLTSKSAGTENANTLIALEIKMEGSTAKVKVVYSPLLEEWKL